MLYLRLPPGSPERQGRWVYTINTEDCRRHGFIFEGPVFQTSYDWAREIDRWCTEKFGSGDRLRWEHCGAWAFRFRDEQDAFEFRLRWC